MKNPTNGSCTPPSGSVILVVLLWQCGIWANQALLVPESSLSSNLSLLSSTRSSLSQPCERHNIGNTHHQRRQQPFFMSVVIQDSLPRSSTGNNNNDDEEKDDEKDMMRKSIEAMREEARNRLEALSKDMAEYQVERESHHQASAAAATSTPPSSSSTITEAISSSETALLLEKKESPPSESKDETVNSSVVEPTPTIASSTTTATTTTTRERGSNNNNDVVEEKPPSPSKRSDKLLMDLLEQPIQVPHAEASALEGTRWKIVFDLGREPGTWMPRAWGASGDRLRFSVVVDFTSTQFYGREEFFDGLAGAKQLRVVEATLGPSFWDRESHGQQQLQVAPTGGGYKIVRGAGPMGTDTLRFFIEVQQEIRKSKKSDVVCPAGRIYGNCGFFPVQTTLSSASNNRKDAYSPKISLKEALQAEYKRAVQRYEELLQDEEEDTRLFSMEQLSRAKDMLQTRNLIKRIERRIQEARQREPDRSQLRLSRRGDVGLSKEGGVCLKVQKGLALEYHILGRMEVASVDKEVPEDHEDLQDLVHKLQP